MGRIAYLINKSCIFVKIKTHGTPLNKWHYKTHINSYMFKKLIMHDNINKKAYCFQHLILLIIYHDHKTKDAQTNQSYYPWPQRIKFNKIKK